MFDETKKKAKDAVDKVEKSATDAADKVAETAADKVENEAADKAKEIAKDAGKKAADIGKDAGEKLLKGEDAETVVKDAADQLVEVAKGAVDDVKNAAIDMASDIAEEALEEVEKVAEEAIAEVEKVAEEAIAEVAKEAKEVADDLAKEVKGGANEAVDGIAGGVKDVLPDEAAGLVDDAADKAKEEASEALDDATDKVDEIVDEVAEEANELVDEVAEEANELVDEVIEELEDLLPSKPDADSMEVTIKGDTFKVGRASLKISLNAVPTLILDLKEEEEKSDSKLSKLLATSEVPANFKWQGKGLDFIAIGFQAGAASPIHDIENPISKTKIYGLLLPKSLQDWFKTRPKFADGLNYGIYQNPANPKTPGWTFLYNVLGKKFFNPSNRYKKRIGQLLPLGACIPRPTGLDNWQFNDYVIQNLKHHIPKLVGWCGFNTDQQPLRFVIFDEDEAVKLDKVWERQSALFPNRYTGATPMQEVSRLRHRGLVVKNKGKMALLRELAKHGITKPLSGFLADGDAKDMVYVPGPVKLGEKLMLCEAISYDF